MHTIQIRVIIERWSDGQLVEFPVLTQELFPAAFIGQNISIHHAPAPGNWPDDLDLFHADNPLERLQEVVLKQREWIPVLTVGDKTVAKHGFTADGTITDPALPTFTQAAAAGSKFASQFGDGGAKLGSRIAAILGGGFQSSPSSSRRIETNDELKKNRPIVGSQLTAEWIEYEITTPGQPVQKIRREIFDLIGPASRATFASRRTVDAPALTRPLRLKRGLALLGQTEILPTVGYLSPDYVVDLCSASMQANKSAMPRLLGENVWRSSIDFLKWATDLKLFPVDLYALALARTMWTHRRSALCRTSLNISSYHRFIGIDAGNIFFVGHAYDIVANNIGVHPAEARDSYTARIEQGVLDTAAEAFLLPLDATITNVGELFASSQNVEAEWAVVSDSADFASPTGSLPRDLLARVRSDLATGHIAVAPKTLSDPRTQSHYGWWRINLRTGNTLGVGDRGWGQSQTEWLLVKQQAIITYGGLLLCGGAATGLKGNLSKRQLVVCTFGSVGAGYAIFGGSIAIAGGLLIAVATGVSLNDSKWLDKPAFPKRP